MLLAVDIGNTQTVIGVYKGEELRVSWRVASDKTATSDQVLIQLHDLLGLEDGIAGNVSDAIISSVVPVLTTAWTNAFRKVLGKEPEVVHASDDYGLKIKYRNPREIGPDRIADAVGAIGKYGAPAIVVDLGTATNIEVIDRDGAFLGGVIAPGLTVSANALFASAARLAQVDVEVPEQVIGRSTIEAVQSGLTFGEVERIDGLVERIKEELGYDATVIATGGLHGLIAPISRTIDVCDGMLTLDGLRMIHAWLNR